MECYRFSPLGEDTNTSNFDCGNDELNDFFRNDALKNQSEWLSATTTLQNEYGKVIGFYTITPDTLHKTSLDLSDKIADYPYLKYPAIKLARLAVDKDFQREGIGTKIIREFFIHALKLSRQEGGRFITVDSKNTALKFYRKFGFKSVGRKNNQDIVPLYLDFKWYCETLVEETEDKLR